MIKAVLFDLDNTLAHTEKLRDIRESFKYDDLTQEILSSIKPYPKCEGIIQKLKDLGILVGVVTNSSQTYTDIVLPHLNLPDFDVVVTYSDVGASGAKPNPGSIELAVKKLGLECKDDILYIGDESIDIEASYRAGVRPIVPTWATRKPISQVPSAVLSSESLFLALETPSEMEFIADRCGQAESFSIDKKELLFAPLDLAANVVTLKDDIKILALGRYFSQKSQLTANLHESHKLSKEIFSKELNTEYETPQYWSDLLGHCIDKIPEYLNFDSFDVVTVIPAKKGKVKRLEAMLLNISSSCSNDKIEFIEDLFVFTDDAISLKSISGADRAITAKQSLLLNESYKELIESKTVLIIDDVVTTGATFNAAYELLEKSASFILGISLAKTVSTSTEQKECSECNRLMRIRRNSKSGEHFWSCTGYQDLISPCSHTENMTIKVCPKCGSDMKKKQNRYNKEYFLGCEGYFSEPKCNHAEQLS